MLRQRRGLVGLHQAGRVLHQLVFPLTQLDLAFDQAAHHANVFGPADRVAAHHHVVLKTQAQMTPRGLVGQFHMVMARLALPVAETGRDEAQGVQHVDLRHAFKVGRRRFAPREGDHVGGGDARLLGGVGLNRADHGLAADLVKGLGAVTGGKPLI